MITINRLLWLILSKRFLGKCEQGTKNKMLICCISATLPIRGLKIDIRIDISISIKPMTTTFSKQVNLGKVTQTRLFKQMLVTSSRQDHAKN